MPALDHAIDLPSVVLLTEQLVGKIIEKRDPLLPESLREPADKAWNEFNRKEHSLVAQARDLPGVTLDKVGLYEEQFNFKLATYNYILGKTRETKDRAWLGRLFEITDDILSSLVEVLTAAATLRLMVENISAAMDIAKAEAGDGDQNTANLPDDFEF